MAKKSTAKSLRGPASAESPAPAEAAPAAPAPPPPKRLIATARPSAGVKNKAARVLKDTTVTKAPALSPTANAAAVTRPAPATNKRATTPATPVPPAPASPKRTTAPKASKPKTAPAVPVSNGKTPRAKKTNAAPSFTHADVALRAYLIAENRHRHGIHAEPHEDWLEAERQLRAESLK